MKKITLAVLALGLIVFSCKKQTDPEPEPEIVAQTNEVLLNITSMWGENTFAYNEEYSVEGTPVMFQDFRFFISDIAFHSDGGEVQSLENQAFIIDAGVEGVIPLGDLNFAHVQEMDYSIGLNAIVNHEDPTVADAPLNDATMHWSWNPASGYKFIRIEGTRDQNGDDSFNAFSIHAATDDLLRNAETEVDQDLVNNVLTIEVTIDFEQFFNGIALSGETLNGTHGSGSIATAVMDNAVGSITIQ